MLVKSEVAGAVWSVEVAIGAKVSEGDTIIIVESMKMEIPICAPVGGTVKEIFVLQGDVISDSQPVAMIV